MESLGYTSGISLVPNVSRKSYTMGVAVKSMLSIQSMRKCYSSTSIEPHVLSYNEMEKKGRSDDLTL